jgi:hypothetical protein
MHRIRSARALLVWSLLAATLAGGGSSLLAVCGPFTDAAADSFCPLILEMFYLGITTGTTATTFDPSGNVSRLQMAAFLSRTVDGTLRRGSRRAALRQFWTPQGSLNLGYAGFPVNGLECDGSNVWVASLGGAVYKIAADTDRLLETWTGATSGTGVLVAMGKIFVVGNTDPNGKLYRFDPGVAPGAVTTVASNLGSNSIYGAFDGGRIWTANRADLSPGSGSISLVTPTASLPWTVTTISLGFNVPVDVLWDGGSLWVSDYLANALLKVNSSGTIVQTVTVGSSPTFPVYDGTNIWVPNNGSNSISVVRASSGAVIATLTGNGLNQPYSSAFDGQRVLVTNAGDARVSLWNAASLAQIGNFSVPAAATDVRSDGINFWMGITGGLLARF